MWWKIRESINTERHFINCFCIFLKNNIHLVFQLCLCSIQKIRSSNTKRTNVYVINIVQFPSVHKTKFKNTELQNMCCNMNSSNKQHWSIWNSCNHVLQWIFSKLIGVSLYHWFMILILSVWNFSQYLSQFHFYNKSQQYILIW